MTYDNKNRLNTAHCQILYSGKLSREKTFTDCLKPIIGGCGTPPNFAEKTFADGSQTSKSAKVFFLESFPLYSNDDMCHLHCVGHPISYYIETLNVSAA